MASEPREQTRCALAFEACFAAAEEPKPQDTLDLSQLPPELLMMLLSHVPPRVLLGRCRQVCRCWDALGDCPTLWLIILARDHRALWPVLQTCLPPASDARPSILSRFCERRPIGQNLIQNLKGKGKEPRKGLLRETLGAARGAGEPRDLWSWES